MNSIRVVTYGANIYEVPYAVLAANEEIRQHLRPEMATPPATGQPLHVLRLPMWPMQFEGFFVAPRVEVELTQPTPPAPASAPAPEPPPQTPDRALNELLAEVRRLSRSVTVMRCGKGYGRLMDILSTTRTQIVRHAVSTDWMKFGVSLHDFADAVGHQKTAEARRILARFVVAAGEKAAMELFAVTLRAVRESFRV